MKKIFITFLGTNAYLHTKYKIDDFISEPVRYVQEALAKYFCKNWNDRDRFIVFATIGENGSIKKNWEKGEISKFDNFGKDFDKEPKGLQDRLKNLNLPCIVEMKEIPDGIKEDEIWKIIKIINDNIEEKSELYIDITHSFRFMPMIIPAMITFLKTTKNITLHSIHYGAFEVLGNNSDVCKMELEKRIAPIRELTEIYKMIEWSEAVNAFLKFGSGEALINQIDNINKNKLDKKSEKLLNPLKRNIKNIDEALKYNNANEIKKAENIKISKKINLEIASNLFALKEISPKIEKYLYQWSDNEVLNSLYASKWCLDNDRFAQALTFAHEGMISFFCKIFGWDKSKKEHRNSIDFTIQIKIGKAKQENFKNSNQDIIKWYKDNIDTALNKLDKIDTDLLENFINLRNWRNTINHARDGDRKNMTKNFPTLLDRYIDLIDKNK